MRLGGPLDAKGAVETSPNRRRALRAYFEARDTARSINPGYVFEECARSCACVRLGAFGRKAEEWIWDSMTCATGIKIPADISGDTSAEGNAMDEPGEDQAPVDIDAMDEAQDKTGQRRRARQRAHQRGGEAGREREH